MTELLTNILEKIYDNTDLKKLKKNLRSQLACLKKNLRQTYEKVTKKLAYETLRKVWKINLRKS